LSNLGTRSRWKGRDENDLGLIAEEVEKINPLFVTYERGQIEGVKYPQLTAVLVKAMQELKADNDNLRGEVEELRGEVAAMKARPAKN
jgi:cell division protein FtsB